MGWDAQNLDNTTVGITITRVLIAGEKNDRVKTICWLKTHSGQIPYCCTLCALHADLAVARYPF